MNSVQLTPGQARPGWAALLSAVAVLSTAFLLHRHLAALPGGRTLALSLAFGLAFGWLLQRSRFCFYCVSRDFIEQRDARGLLGILAALAVGTLGYHAVFGAFLPEPAAGRLPPRRAHRAGEHRAGGRILHLRPGHGAGRLVHQCAAVPPG